MLVYSNDPIQIVPLWNKVQLEWQGHSEPTALVDESASATLEMRGEGGLEFYAFSWIEETHHGVDSGVRKHP